MHHRIEKLVSRGLLCALTLAVVALAAGCGDDPADPPVPATITISPRAATLQSLTETVQLTATVQDQNGQAMTGVTITWASRGNQVAAVDNSGLVTAAGNGMAIIEASAGTTVGTAEVTVEQQPAEVRVSPATDSLVALGDTLRLAAEAFDANGHPVAGAQFTWTSDDESVVTVDAGGLVTAVGNGEASVTASVESVVGEAVVTVDQRPTEVRISPAADTLVAIADTLRLAAEALDANGHPVPDVQFTWTSDDEAVVTVDADGLVTAVGNGEAGVTASAGPVAGESAVTVEQRPAEVRISPGADTLMALGDTVRLSAEAFDANGHLVPDVQFTWTSDDEAVATVDADGLVTAVGDGEVGVTATTADVTGSAAVTVEQRPFEVRVSPATDSLVALGDTLRLAADAFDANGHPVAGAQFTWASDDESVATVDADGLVTAVGNGEASVTASTESAAGSAAVTVEQRPAEVRVSPAADTLVALGDTLRLSAQALDANGHPVAGTDFSWTSDDESVVTVDADGLVTAVGNGEAGVTASTADVTGSAAVTVEQRPAEVRISPAADTLVALGDSVRLSAEALDANGHVVPETEFTWQSGDTSIVAVDSTALVTAVTNGSAEVTASAGEVVGKAIVTVAQRAVEMRVWPEADTLFTEDTLRLSAEAKDANGHLLTHPEFTWSSGDESLAAVDEGGLVTGVAAGSVEITVVEGTAGLTRTALLFVVDPREELAMVYEALGGDGWTNSENWGTDAPLAEWYGVTTDGEGRITELDLSENGLSGAMPPELARLESLEVLNLSENGAPAMSPEPRDSREMAPEFVRLRAAHPPAVAFHGAAETPDLHMMPERPVGFALRQAAELEPCVQEVVIAGAGLTGSIPPELGELQGLKVLDLSRNSLSGSIPPELGNIESLEELNLGYNQLTGSIPAELGDLGNLEVLNLCVQHQVHAGTRVGGLTGSIPPELGNLGSLRVLDFTWTFPWFGTLSGGSIPAELGNLGNLEALILGWNRLSGSIPAELGNLGRLVWLDLSGNSLSGSIPAELGNLEGLSYLYLRFNNQLTGSIPAELGNLGSLEELVLNNNQLTGSIPAELGNLGSLGWLDLRRNQLTGSIPAELGNLESLDSLDLYDNQLTGSIPTELGNLGSLESLVLYDNQLTGSIPTELGNLGSLESLVLSRNQLTGSIPAELGNLGSLVLLVLGSNQLTGSIPTELGNLGSLESLVLYDNQLTGSIPAELGNLDSLVRLWLGGNQLTGSIPAELGNLESLEELRLDGGNLTGSIPAELGNLGSLEALWLGSNQLTGSVPAELGNLGSLEALSLQDNTGLEGPISHDFTKVALNSFFWYDTNLCAPTDDEFQKCSNRSATIAEAIIVHPHDRSSWSRLYRRRHRCRSVGSEGWKT